jgi:hypothetical protein
MAVPRPSEAPGNDASGPPDRSDRDRTPLNWLLLLPLVLVLWPPLFNRRDPELFGIPFFYWYQLAVIPIGVASTAIVYRATTRRGGRS